MTTSDPARNHASDIGAIMAEPAVAQAHMGGAPVIIASLAPAKVLYASASAANLFGSRDHGILSQHLFETSQPGSQRLRFLAASSVPSGPRLERLRFFVGGGSEILMVQCRTMIAASGAALLVMVALGVRAALLRAPVPEPVMPCEPTVSVADEALVSDAKPTLQAVEAAASPTIPDERRGVAAAAALARPETTATVAETPAASRQIPLAPLALEAACKLARPQRFSWRSDAQDCVTDLPEVLIQATGLSRSQILGQNWPALASKLHLGGAEALAQALARRTTWAGLDILWPIAGSNEVVPVILGATPVLDKQGQFEFFRGFGQIQFDRISPAPPNSPVAQPELLHHAGPVLTDVSPVVVPETEAAADTVLSHLVPHPVGADFAIDALLPPTSAEHSAPREDATLFSKEGEVREEAEDEGTPDEATDGEPVPAFVLDPGLAGPAGTSTPAGREEANVVRLRPLQGHLKLATPEAGNDPAQPVKGSLSPILTAKAEAAQPPDGLSTSERAAFSEIARSLAAKIRTNAPEILNPPPRKADVKADTPANANIAGTANQRADGVGKAVSVMAAPPAGNISPNVPSVLEHLPLGVLICRNEIALYANQYVLNMLGYDSATSFISGNGLVRMFRGRHPDAFDPAPDGGALPLINSAGDVVMAETRLQKLEWEGETASLLTFRRAGEPDHPARILTLEMELRQHETQARELHAILDTATDGVAILDDAGRILSLNRSAEALFGLDQNEVAGEIFTVLIAADQEHLALDYFQGIKTNGVASVLNDGREMLGRARQGGAIPLFMTLGRVGPGTNPKFCAILRDLTQWKKVEGELGDARRDAERASQLKSDFLAKISHEIRTPLNAILGFTEVMVEERFGAISNDRYKDYLKDIHTSGTHVMSLVNDLLDLSKIEAGKMDLDFASVDANKVVAEAVSIMQPQASAARVVMRQSLAPRLPNIVADERAIRQIVLNLLSNAVKFNEAGGQVIVSTALTDAGHAVIRIRDTGIGMNETDIQSALEPFKQLQTSRKQTGTGLGLPLTKALVEANRASFTIKSKKGEGTLVEVAFPPTRVLAE